ncbi:MAG: hypothetical protein MI740_03250 [Halanaerobiales bacterium]|nr:hypothetical protein [Halanaerobiales bacterium]
MKKVLVFTISTGGGHNQAATVLKKEFAEHGYQVVKLDALRETSGLLNSAIINGYKMLVNNFPGTYGGLYRLTNKEGTNRKVTGLITYLLKDKIAQLIAYHQPVAIITTHPFLVDVIGKLKGKGEVNLPFIVVITDFDVHYTCLNQEVDAYITGSYYTKQSLIANGIPAAQVFHYGIPIKREFFNQTITEQSKRDNSFAVLLMGGSMGMKSINQVLERLLRCQNKLSIMVVCGKNIKLKKRIAAKYREAVNGSVIDLYGYSQKIPELMEQADVIITKPGGLTISEAIAKKLPIIVPFLIPGQEQENLDFLLHHQVAIRARNFKEITTIVDDLIEHPETLQQMRSNLTELARTQSLNKTIKLVDTMCKQRESRINIMIMTAGFGSGHSTVAQAIKEQLLEYNPDLAIEIVDIIKIIYPKTNNLLYRSYQLLIKNNHSIYNYFYYGKTEKKEPVLDQMLLKLYLPKIAKCLLRQKPSLIISTFPLASGLVSRYKSKYKQTTPLLTCITDHVNNKEWVYPATDQYLVATEHTRENLVRHGVKRELINVTGIPLSNQSIWD